MGDPSVQEKYNQIMTITLDKLETPLRNSEQVIERIAALLEVDLPQKKKPPVAAAQAQQIMVRLTQAENLANALLFLEGALQHLNYEPPIPLYVPATNVPDPGVTRTLRSRAELDALLDAISLSGVSAQQPPQMLATATTTSSAPVVEKRQAPRPVTYADFQIDDPRKRDAPVGFSITDSAPPKPAPDLSGYIIQRPSAQASSSNGRTVSVSSSTPPVVAASPATPSPTPAATSPALPASTPAPASAPSASSDPWANIETANLDDLQKKMPKWTKGPPCTSEEIDEYKAFMVQKYEAEQKLNAEILRRKKLGLA